MSSREINRELLNALTFLKKKFLFCFIDPQVQLSVDAFNEFGTPADIDFLQ